MGIEQKRFTVEELRHYGDLQRYLYSAIDDVLIKYEDQKWYIFCNDHHQLVLATLALALKGYGAPQSLQATSHNSSTYYGFQLGTDYYLLYRPEGDPERSKLSVQEVREHFSTILQQLVRVIS